MRFSPTFKTRIPAGREKDCTAKVENVVNEPRKPVAAKYRVFGLNLPVYSLPYIKRPSRKLPAMFTISVDARGAADVAMR